MKLYNPRKFVPGMCKIAYNLTLKKISLIEKKGLSVTYSDVRCPWWPKDFRLSKHVSQK